MGWYQVTLSFTGQRTFEIEADSEEEAHAKALVENESLAEIEAAEILATLERWPDADDVQGQS